MTSSANLRPPRAAVRTTRIRATLALAAGLAIMLAVPAAARAAAPPDGLTARDWQAIRAQLPATPKSWTASSGQVQQAKLLASDAQANDWFGTSVAVSGDTVVVGALGEDDGGVEAGAAYAFVRNGTTWTEQAKLMASDAQAGDWFGYSVAMSGDTVVVGAYYEDSGGSDAGAAYVFVRNGTTWTEQAKLMASDAQAGDWFGYSVAVSGDTVMVGALGEDDGGVEAGAAYVFVRNGTTWNEQDKLVASDAQASDFFGTSVAVSGDTVVVGVAGEGSGGVEAGAAYVFVRNGTTWTEQDKLMASDAETFDQFGLSVAVSGDTVLVGAFGESISAGATYVFARNGTTWSEQDKLVASDAQADGWFGYSVAVSGDTVVVGASGEGSYAGAAYVFIDDAIFADGFDGDVAGQGLVVQD